MLYLLVTNRHDFHKNNLTHWKSINTKDEDQIKNTNVYYLFKMKHFKNNITLHMPLNNIKRVGCCLFDYSNLLMVI